MIAIGTICIVVDGRFTRGDKDWTPPSVIGTVKAIPSHIAGYACDLDMQWGETAAVKLWNQLRPLTPPKRKAALMEIAKGMKI